MYRYTMMSEPSSPKRGALDAIRGTVEPSLSRGLTAVSEVVKSPAHDHVSILEVKGPAAYADSCGRIGLERIRAPHVAKTADGWRADDIDRYCSSRVVTLNGHPWS